VNKTLSAVVMSAQWRRRSLRISESLKQIMSFFFTVETHTIRISAYNLLGINEIVLVKVDVHPIKDFENFLIDSKELYFIVLIDLNQLLRFRQITVLQLQA
jgi:hypothetical protein